MSVLLLLIAMLAAMASLAPAAELPAINAPVKPVLTGDAASYQSLVETLADPSFEGRGVGTAGIEKARAFITDHFRRAGLQPIVTPQSPQTQPAGEAAAAAPVAAAPLASPAAEYTQRFDVPMGVRLLRQELAIVAGEGEKQTVTKAKPGEDFNAMGFSGSKAFDGPVVFVGYGIVNYKAPSRPDPDHPERAPSTGYDSYRGAGANALVGKVAVAFRYEPQDGRGRSLWAERDDDDKDEKPGAATQPAEKPSPLRKIASLNAIAGFSGSRWSAAASLASKADEAARRGAVALIVVDPPSLEGEAEGAVMPPSRTEGGNPSRIPVIHGSTKWLRNLVRAADKDPDVFLRGLQRKADGGGGQLDDDTGVVSLPGATLRGDIALEREQTPAHNVIASLPGAGDLAKRVVVIGAHYDHLGFGEFGSLARKTPAAPTTNPSTQTSATPLAVSREPQRLIHNGADDNASGTAGVLMLADRFANWARELPADAPRRTLVFVTFSGEERGLLGSRYMAAHLDELGIKKSAVDAMVNFDMIGRLRDDKLTLYNLETSKDWRKLIDHANQETALTIVPMFESPGLTDSHSFKLQKIPALHFYTGMHGDYHRPSDTAEKINAIGAVRVLDMADALIRRLATDKDAPRFSP